MFRDLIAYATVDLEYTILVVCTFLLVVMVFMWHRDSNRKVDLVHLIVDSDTGKTSLYKIGQVIALLVSTWIIIHETSTGKLTEWLFLCYMVSWGGVNIAKRYIDMKKPDAVSSQTQYPNDEPARTQEEIDNDNIRCR